MNVVIRKAELQDYPAVLALIKEFAQFQKTPQRVTITIEQMREEKHLFQCFIAQIRTGAVIGFTTYFFAYYSWTGKALYLDDLYVTAAYRKQGIGKQLLDTIIQLAKEQQCRKVRWQVSQWNKSAIAFYHSMGALIDETELNCDLNIMADE